MSGAPLRVLVVSESDTLAARIEASLRVDPGARVVVGEPSALARLIDEHDPVLVVLVSTTARLGATLSRLALVPGPPVVLLVDDPHAAWTSLARRAGVRAVLGLEATGEEISVAAAAVVAGLISLHPDVFAATRRATAREGDRERALTRRELQILEMMAEGLSNDTIGRRLGISAYTVKFHVGSILEKLDAASRTEAVTLGVRRGLISL